MTEQTTETTDQQTTQSNPPADGSAGAGAQSPPDNASTGSGESAAIAELQQRLDETTVAKDKEINDLKGKLAETERRYQIAVKTGSKTDVQANPVDSNPVAAWIDKNFNK